MHILYRIPKGDAEKSCPKGTDLCAVFEEQINDVALCKKGEMKRILMI